MQAAGCQNHPAREAIGLCVACRRRVCGECVTKIEGINYCVDCLAGLAAKGGRRATARKAASPRAVPFVVALQACVLSLALFAILQLILPG